MSYIFVLLCGTLFGSIYSFGQNKLCLWDFECSAEGNQCENGSYCEISSGFAQCREDIMNRSRERENCIPTINGISLPHHTRYGCLVNSDCCNSYARCHENRCYLSCTGPTELHTKEDIISTEDELHSKEDKISPKSELYTNENRISMEDFSADDTSTTIETNQGNTGGVKNPYKFMTSLLIVNSTIPTMDAEYSAAVAATLGPIFNVDSSNIQIVQSHTRRRRLSSLFILVADMEVTVPYERIPSTYVTKDKGLDSYLLEKLSYFIKTGKATTVFRYELFNLHVPHDPSIRVVAAGYLFPSPTAAPVTSYAYTSHHPSTAFSDSSIVLISVTVVIFVICVCIGIGISIRASRIRQKKDGGSDSISDVSSLSAGSYEDPDILCAAIYEVQDHLGSFVVGGGSIDVFGSSSSSSSSSGSHAFPSFTKEWFESPDKLSSVGTVLITASSRASTPSTISASKHSAEQ